MWDAATGQPLGAPLAHQDGVASAAFSPDGTRVVTASYDRTARVWDAATGQPLGAPLDASGRGVERRVQPRRHARGHRERRQDRAGVGRGDRQAARAPRSRIRARVRSAAFSPDGTRMVTASEDQTAQVWKIPLDDTPWEALAARCPFVVTGGALEQRMPPTP